MFNSRDIIQKTYFGQNLTFQSTPVTFKMRSMSPTSNLLLPSSQQCTYASFVKIHQLVQKKTHGNHILDISKCLCDLENKVKVTKIKSTLSLSNTMYLCKLVKMHLLFQKITHGNHILIIQKCTCYLKIRSRSPKSNQLFPSPNNVSM